MRCRQAGGGCGSRCVLVCILQGHSFVEDLRPPLDRGLDFFQDWASARNYLLGEPIYTPHEVTLRKMGVRVDPNNPFFVPVNAHPPTSVLIAVCRLPGSSTRRISGLEPAVAGGFRAQPLAGRT